MSENTYKLNLASMLIRQSEKHTESIYPLDFVIDGYHITGEVIHTSARRIIADNPGAFVIATIKAKKNSENAFRYYTFRANNLWGFESPSKTLIYALVTHNFSRYTYYDMNNKPYPKHLTKMMTAVRDYINENERSIRLARISAMATQKGELTTYLNWLEGEIDQEMRHPKVAEPQYLNGDRPEQRKIILQMKARLSEKTDIEIITIHQMGVLLGVDSTVSLTEVPQEKYLEWIACEDLLIERGYEYDERHHLWEKRK